MLGSIYVYTLMDNYHNSCEERCPSQTLWVYYVDANAFRV